MKYPHHTHENLEYQNYQSESPINNKDQEIIIKEFTAKTLETVQENSKTPQNAYESNQNDLKKLRTQKNYQDLQKYTHSQQPRNKNTNALKNQQDFQKKIGKKFTAFKSKKNERIDGKLNILQLLKKKQYEIASKNFHNKMYQKYLSKHEEKNRKISQLAKQLQLKPFKNQLQSPDDSYQTRLIQQQNNKQNCPILDFDTISSVSPCNESENYGSEINSIDIDLSEEMSGKANWQFQQQNKNLDLDGRYISKNDQK